MYFGYLNLLLPISSSSDGSKVVLDTTAASATTDVPPVVPTYCGDIIDYANQDLTNNLVFYAEPVYQCLTSVPFNDAVATRFIEYYNTTIQFQSTLAYLKDPPLGYQQPAIDVAAGLDEIQRNITAGQYKNQYDFEAALQSLVYSMHDSHVGLAAGILSAFTFGSPLEIMSLSPDGKQAPQVYLKYDVVHGPAEGWDVSPVISINGEDVTQYLQRFAATNSVGMLEPHADWNQLMFNPVQDILGNYNVFGWQTTFYPGDELVFTLANNTIVEVFWQAFYQNYGYIGPLTTGGDFYNYFVLGLLPASFVAPNGSDTQTTDGDANLFDDGVPDTPDQTSWYQDSTAFPEYADVVQPGLSVAGSGILTGYFFPELSIGVLSIPSFDEFGDSIGDFSNTVGDFIRRAKETGLSRIVIDLQQNTGGTSLLAIDTFQQFFPDIEPYVASRRRSHDLANVLGGAISNYWASLTPDDTDGTSGPGDANDDYDDYYELYAANEWVVTDRLDAATGQNFTSWSEYYGPITEHNDTFSRAERYNLSSITFMAAAFQTWLPSGYGGAPADTPWNAENIVLLTNGICGSTCALFVEMMNHQAGVRTIVAGGMPQTGPMQAVSGSRGASAYSADALDDDITFARENNDTAKALLPEVRETGVYTFALGINLRDQVRENSSTPLQFQYEAADCRIYYSLANAVNMTRLWLDAAAATWDDPSLCVEDSTGYATSRNSTSAKAPPPRPVIGNGEAFIQGPSAIQAQYPQDFSDSLLQDPIFKKQSGSFGPCDGTCASSKCMNVTCPVGSDYKSVRVCQPPCNDPGSRCGDNQGNCVATVSTSESKAYTAEGKESAYGHENFNHGYCVPKKNYKIGCDILGQ